MPRFVAAEAWHEFRAGCRGPLIPIVFVGLILIPVVPVWIVPALAVPEAFSLLDPLLYFGVVFAPSLLELCAVVLLAHALLRHAGAAHAVGIICAFVMVVNHEVGVVSYPPAEVGIPPHVALSEFTGWTPWLGYVATANLFKLALAAGIAALACCSTTTTNCTLRTARASE